MNKLRLIFLTSVISLSACVGNSNMATNHLEKRQRDLLTQKIDAILADSLLATTQMGVKVVSLKTNQPVYEKNPTHLFHPASNMKLLTTATALVKLGVNYRFKTILAVDSLSMTDTLIVGNLYLKGFGNPDLQTDNLRGMARKLKRQGIRRVDGNIVVDDSYFDDVRKGWGWMWEDAGNWYWPAISALSVNDNCVTIWVRPGKEIGSPLRIALEPDTRYLRVDNQGLTVDLNDSLRLNNFSVSRKWQTLENIVLVKGGLPLNSNQRKVTVDVEEPALYAGHLFSELLDETDILFNGNILQGTLPDTHQTLATHYSAPLTATINNINKISDNHAAEMLLKTMSAHSSDSVGTARGGLFEVTKFLQQIGVDTTKMKLADGSGDSRYNLISPNAIVTLLQHMYNNFKLRAEFTASLPVAGVDGSLRRQMRGTPAQGKLHAKTGTLRGVSALSGYTETGEGEPLAFSIILSNYTGSASKIRTFLARIGAALSE